MELNKCPRCQEPQKILTLLLINNITNKKCHKCGCALAYDSGKSALLMAAVLVPMFVLAQFKSVFGGWLLICFAASFLGGIYAFLARVPLVEKHET